jgi:hypothetical protein
MLHEQFFDETARNNHERGWTGAIEKLERYLGAKPLAESRKPTG